METIKNYLEAMFANMPNTDDVKKAKNELLQMMEDKYNELIADGHSDNEAVGTVISEFGNLEELAKDLGISKEAMSVDASDKRLITFDEVKDFLKARAGHGFYIALGVFFCIISVAGACGLSELNMKNAEMIGVVSMFVLIAAGVFCFVFSSSVNSKWDYIFKENCYIDIHSIEWMKEQKEQHRQTWALQRTIGIILCVLCVVPAIIIDEMEITSNVIDVDNLSGVFLFIFVAVGVFLIVYSSICLGSYDKLIYLNDENTVSGEYKKNAHVDKDVRYKNKTVDAVMSVYWPTVTCIYLSWSFLTFDWHVTWIVWVIASLIQMMIQTICETE